MYKTYKNFHKQYHGAAAQVLVVAAIVGIIMASGAIGSNVNNRQTLTGDRLARDNTIKSVRIYRVNIVGDAELDAYCAGNGTDGSLANPHVINGEDRDIAFSYLITITDTTRYVVIVNWTLYPGEDESAIVLTNVTGVSIINCIIVAKICIAVHDSSVVFIANCTFSGAITAFISLQNVSHSLVAKCTGNVSYREFPLYGLFLDSVDHVQVTTTHLVSIKPVILNLETSSGTEIGFYFKNVTDCTLDNSSALSLNTGIYLENSMRNNVTSCNFTSIGWWLDLFSADPLGRAIVEGQGCSGNVFTGNIVHEARWDFLYLIIIVGGSIIALTTLAIATKPRRSIGRKMEKDEKIERISKASITTGLKMAKGFLGLTDRRIVFTSPKRELVAWLGQVTSATASGNTLTITTGDTSTDIEVHRASEWAATITQKTGGRMSRK
nr:right-handed parallel beta-helix repeat-containing protein [Candidatus Sigynarchaeota archaeon]